MPRQISSSRCREAAIRGTSSRASRFRFLFLGLPIGGLLISADEDRPPAPPRGGAAGAASRGRARADAPRPARFPQRIWAACDFEGQTPDYGWFGRPETKNVPRYPGNGTALAAGERSVGTAAAAMTGINPVPGPRMGKVNGLYLRYRIEGADRALFQHFSLTREDNQHLEVSGLAKGKWSELTLSWTRDALRNDGSAEPFGDGERMDDFKVFAGSPGERVELFIDDVIFFAEDPALPPEPEPFPRRVIFLAAFDTGEKEKYWPGDFELAEKDLPAGAWWRAARAVPRSGEAPAKGARWIRLAIAPPRPVGERTKLRFRYFLRGRPEMTVQIFDATDQDNRHLRLRGLQRGAWAFAYADFARDGRRNDGQETPFAAGHLVDDLFFFPEPEGDAPAELLVDEVTLFDAGP